MNFSLLPVAKGLLDKESGTTAVEEVVKQPRKEEGPLEDKVNKGQINDCCAF